MAIQFDMSKNDWQRDYLAQERIAELGKNLGTGLGVVGEKVIPAVGKTLLGAAIGGSKKLFPEGGKKIVESGKKFGENAKSLLSKLFPQGGEKIKQGANTAVDLFIGDKDMLDQFEGSQDSPLMKMFKQKKLNRLQEQARKKSLTPSIEMSDKYVDERPQDVEFGEVDFGLPSEMYRKTTPMPGLEPLPEFEAPIPRPVTPDYIIEDELQEKEKRDNYRRLTSPSEIGQRLYGKKGALDDAMLNQNYGPLQQMMLLQQIRPSTTEQQIMEMYK
tara:strand:+ start:3031 stop:3849 length:819 start_codon:yes stop_codon:yes gene_type:complete